MAQGQEPDLIVSAGFSDAQLVREADKVVAFYRKRGEEAQKAFQDAQGKVTNTQAARAHKRELDTLAKAYDPAYRAARRYEDEVKRLDRALDVGAISQKQYTAEVARAAVQMQQASTAANAAGTAVERGARVGGGGLQNFGYQVGDFAVQVGAGTSAAQALGQQLPQLLGGMGTIGALMGAAAAIAIPLGAALLKVANDSQTLEERVEALSKSTDAYVDAAEAAQTPVEDLRAKYGDLADEMERVNDLTAKLAQIQASRDLVGAAQAAPAELFDLDSFRLTVAEVFAGGQGVVLDDLDKLQYAAKVTEGQARSLKLALDRLQTTHGPETAIADAENLRKVLIDIAGSPEAAQERFGEQLATLATIITEGARQVAVSDKLQRQSLQDLLDEYDGTTQKLKSLSKDRETAERALADAVAAGNADQIASYERVIEAIDKEREATKHLARESDAAFRKMASGYAEYAESRRAGEEWARSPEGYEAQYASARARGEGGADQELVRAVAALSQKMGIAAQDLLAVMSFETGGKLRPDVLGPTTKNGQHFGLIQFGDKASGPRYGVTAQSTVTEQVEAAGKYLADAGVKAGDSIANIYAAVLSGNAKNVTASDLAAGGVVGNVSDAVYGDQFAPHIAQAAGLLAAYGGDVKAASDAQTEATRKLKEEVQERERIAKQVKDYAADLSKQLLSSDMEKDLTAKRDQKVAAIRSSGMSELDQAKAIAVVNAELEKQRLIFTLLEDAKRRQVDIDALMAGSTMTYRQAIESLGEARRQSIVTEAEQAASLEQLSHRQQLSADIQNNLQQGLINSIMAGDSFADTLGNIAKMMAEAALQAALFNQGGLASGSGKGLLGGLFSGVSGWLTGGSGAGAGAGDAAAGGGTNWLKGLFGGFRAAGGPVQPGKAYVVGEKGPEVIVPGSVGTVIPNHRLGGGKSSPTFAPVLHIGGQVTQGDIDRVMGAMGQLRAEVPSIMNNHKLREE